MAAGAWFHVASPDRDLYILQPDEWGSEAIMGAKATVELPIDQMKPKFFISKTFFDGR